MRGFKNALLIACASGLFFSSFSQGLKIGKQVPDLQFMQVHNYGSSTLKFSDFKGKWIILDFWSTRCASCIKSFPKMDSLQKLFKDQIQIILVSEQGFDTAVQFIKKLKIKRPELPIIASDKRLTSLFPHEGVPHLVWINTTGQFYSATSGSNATASTIKKLLDGKQVRFKQREPYQEYQTSKPLIASVDSISFNTMFGYSYLLPGSVKFRQVEVLQKVNGSKLANRIFLTRFSMLKLFTIAYSGRKYDFNYPNAVVLEVKDSSRFIRPADGGLIDEWEEKNLFTYDLLVPAANASRLYSIMQEDLESYFNIDASIERRAVQCLVLTSVDSCRRIATKNEKPFQTSKVTDSVWEMRNMSIGTFVHRLRMILKSKSLKIPLVDDTGYDGNIDIVLSRGLVDKFSPFDIDAFNFELRKYGLVMKVQDHVTDVLTLRENDQKN